MGQVVRIAYLGEFRRLPDFFKLPEHTEVVSSDRADSNFRIQQLWRAM